MTDINADHEDVDAPNTATTDAAQHETDRASLADLDDPGHLFDQTNGLADGLDGDSDGTADGEQLSAAERGTTEDDVDAGADAGTGGVPFNPTDRI